MDNRIENMFKRRTTDTIPSPTSITTPTPNPNPDQQPPPPDAQSADFMSLYQEAKKPSPLTGGVYSKTDNVKLKDSLKGLFGDRDFYGTFGMHSNVVGQNESDSTNQGQFGGLQKSERS
jgi:hypothetical protein